MSKVTVVYIRSLAYAGSTWVNLVLGSHREAFALGVPDYVWRLGPDQADRACSVHGADCPFWPPFLERLDRDGNFMLQLAEASGRRIIVMNNISLGLLEQAVVHPDVELKYVVLVRDGRANIVSALRHTPELFADRFHVIRTWLQPAWEGIFQGIPDDPATSMILRYEDMVADPQAQLQRVGALLGIDYAPNALKYWEYEHHFVNGNTGAIGVLKDMQGIERREHARESYYQDLAEHTRRAPESPKLDESWKSFLTREDRVAYDYAVGALHERMGYERDRIDPEELQAFIRKYGLPDDPSAAPEMYPGSELPASEPPVATVATRSWRGRLKHVLRSAKARLTP